MNDERLKELLERAKTPEPPESYWREFPGRVTRSLRQQQRAEHPGMERRRAPAWAFPLGTACAAIAVIGILTFGHRGQSRDQLAEARKCYQEFEALFPNQLKAIVFDKTGPRMVLADQATVPASTPLFVRICGKSGCESVVTFSGQEIRYENVQCEVLEDASGRVMLVSGSKVWSQGDSGAAVRVESRPLGGTL